MSPLGSISNSQTSQNVLNTPAANSGQSTVASGLKSPASSGVEVDLNSNQTASQNASVYDRASLAKQLNQNKSEYASPVDMSLEAKDNDPDNLVLVIDKKALDKAAEDVVKAQEIKANQEAEEAKTEEEEEEESGIMSVLGHVATVGTLVSLLV